MTVTDMRNRHLSGNSRSTSLPVLNEEWRAVVGYEGEYQVSNRGNVRSLTRVVGGPRGSKRTLKGRSISLNFNVNGYFKVALAKNSKRTSLLVHRLVCEAFHGPAPDGKPFALHGDGDKLNNRSDNLRWGSSSENAQDAMRHGTHSSLKGEWDHCKRGHAFDEENTYVPPSGGQYCRKCRVIRESRKRPPV